MNTGRNEPCPCGSGKKYKRCCGAPKTDPLELAAGAVRAAQDSAETKVVRLLRNDLGDDAFDAAWDEFDLTEGCLDPELDDEVDGDLIEFHTLTYRIDGADAAFTALAPLAVDIDREELLVDAKRDRGGTLRHVTLPWTRIGDTKHGGLPSTILANVTIDGTTLTVSVNSAKRAKAARATFLRDEVQSFDEAMIAHAGKRETAKARAARQRDEELQAAPEVQAMIAKMNADHYATWPDVPLPA